MNLPWPPADFGGRPLPTTVLRHGASLSRFFGKLREPIHFDSGAGGRLNAPDGSYGVLYAAERDAGAFAETFLREPGRTLLPADLVAARARVRLRTTREVTLAQLHGPAFAIAGATAEVTSRGLPYDLPQAWSKAIHDHPGKFDGIAYRARHDDDQICFAIFDRAASAIEEDGRDDDLDVDWFYELMNRYGVGSAPP